MKVAVMSLLLAAIVALAQGHMCMLYPRQRGSYDGFTKPGSADCNLVTAPCGGRPYKGALGAFAPGEFATIMVQKNKNYFNAAAPGHFVLSMGPTVSKLTKLGTFPDTNAPDLTLYKFNVTIPDLSGINVFQAVYKPNNPQFKHNYYQCSDVDLG